MGVIQFWIVGRSHSVSEVFAARELAPWRRLQGDSTPLLKKILYLNGHMIYHDTQFHYPFSFKIALLSRAHTHQIIKKNMVRHIKTAFENQKNKQTNKLTTPPSAYQKSHDPPHILPPPSSKNNERSLTTQWLACNTCNPRGHATFCVQN